MLKKIRQAMEFLRLKSAPTINPTHPSESCDPKASELRKSVAAKFFEQSQAISARALKPHSPECDDIMSCIKEPCWKFIPDKICEEEPI